MQGLSDFLNYSFRDSLRGIVEIPPGEGTLMDFPDELEVELSQILRQDKIQKLYSHQREAFDRITKKEDTLLLSRTASGKTLSFLLPILNLYKKTNKKFSTLLLYPTKALSRDQENTLGKLLQVSTNTKFGTFDGDTAREERENLTKNADFIISNPDMLHSGILPNHNRKWKSFLSRLAFIVVDEVHIYRGAFGSHVSNVFRRLLRVCATHGSSPTFICSSATIGNPGQHAAALFHRNFSIVDRDGSPSGEKKIYFLNPPLVANEFGTTFRKGTSSISIPLLRFTAEKGIRTICFCRARQEVERLYVAVTERNPELKTVIKPYRGGLLPNERRELEKGLFSGKINTIITTNALELGIDIGDMDLCILNGHPGTLSSFWQQAGRVGRRGRPAGIVFIAKDAPIDQYIIHHNHFVTDTPTEEAWLSADNPYIFLQHLPCAAYEYPLKNPESLYPNEIYSTAIQTLIENSTLKSYKEYYRYAQEEYPSKGVNLRGLTDYNIEIVSEGKVIGEIDPIGAMGTLYKDAIYQHMGNKYMSLDLDMPKKICTVQRIDVDYFTEAVWESMVDMTDELESSKKVNSELKFGYIKVSREPKLYKKIKERTYENIGYGPITLSPFTYETTGFSIALPEIWVKEIQKIDSRYSEVALFSLAYILKNTAPFVCMADPSDVHTDVALSEANSHWKSMLYLYDAIEGGIGFSEKIFEKISDVLQMTFKIVVECECTAGCPSCVPPLPPGLYKKDIEELLLESNGARESVKSLLYFYNTGEYKIPEIRTFSSLLSSPQVSIIDPEAEKLRNRLKRSAEILKNRRERKH